MLKDFGRFSTILEYFESRGGSETFFRDSEDFSIKLKKNYILRDFRGFWEILNDSRLFREPRASIWLGFLLKFVEIQ